MTLAISNTEISTFSRCLRRWYIAYYLGFVPAHEPAASSRNLGIRVHVAMEARYYDLDPLAVLAILYAIENQEHPEEADKLAAEQEMAQIMVEGYLEWAAETGDEADWQVVAAETDLRVQLSQLPGVELRVKMDQVARRISDGALAFRDWKTSANFEKHEILAQDPQMRFYCMVQQMSVAARERAPLVSGGRITTMRRVKRTEKSKPPYYVSDDFRFNPDQLDATYRRTLKICGQIQEMRNRLDEAREAFGDDIAVINAMQRSELYPTWIGTDCSWSCPFASGLCASMDDGSDWAGILLSSGRYKQDDPYAYYERNPLATIRAMITQGQQ